MKNYKQPLTLAVVGLSFILGISSCLNDVESGELAYGDAVIKSFWDGDTIKYTTELFTYSWYGINSVSAYAKNDTNQIYDLQPNDYFNTFSYIPDRSQANKQSPLSALYYFDVLLEDGSEYTAIDFLDSTKVDPPVVNELIWNNTFKRLELIWNEVENADYYKVMLLNSSNEIVFNTDLLPVTDTSLIISAYSDGWYANQQPTANGNYLLMVCAYLFEPSPTIFDLQCLAVNDLHNVEWMPETNDTP